MSERLYVKTRKNPNLWAIRPYRTKSLKYENTIVWYVMTPQGWDDSPKRTVGQRFRTVEEAAHFADEQNRRLGYNGPTPIHKGPDVTYEELDELIKPLRPPELSVVPEPEEVDPQLLIYLEQKTTNDLLRELLAIWKGAE